METPISPSSEEKVTLIQTDLRRTIMTESIVFIIIGVTSFLSLIFLPRGILLYLIGAILYGGIQIFAGSIGLIGSHKVIIKLVLGYLVLIVCAAILNILAIVTCFALLIQHFVKGVPECSQSCELTRFVYVVYVGYFLMQTLVDTVLLIFCCISFKHALIFYKKEKQFV